MNTIEGKKLIAKFMARSYQFDYDLKYHSSWDWLYEPYKKFFSLTEFDTVTDGKYHNRNPHFVQRLEDLQKAWSSLDIKLAFEQLVISIEWYNKEQEAQVSDTTKAE